MSGLYNQFNHSNYLPAQTPFVVDITPLCQITENLVRSERTGDQDARIYNVFNQSKDRISQQTNLVDKISKLIKEDEEKEEDQEYSAEVQTRYFNLESIDVISKGVCRRCKKPGHFEKWCVEDIAETKIVCRFCLGEHYYLRCPNNICFKCNQPGHMAKDCDAEGMKCHRCNKKGHKQRDCNIIIVEENNVFEQDKQRLKDLFCLNCKKRGHLNCFSQQIQKYDMLYCEGKELKEREKMNRKHSNKNDNHNHKHKEQQGHQIPKIQYKAIKSVNKHNYEKYNESGSQYSVWSEESPDTKRRSNNKKQKKKNKQQRRQYRNFN